MSLSNSKFVSNHVTSDVNKPAAILNLTKSHQISLKSHSLFGKEGKMASSPADWEFPKHTKIQSYPRNS